MPDTPIYTGLGAKELLTVSFAVPVGVTTGMIELAAAASDTLPAGWLTPDAVAIDSGTATASLMVGSGETINPPTGIYWLWYRVVSGGEVLIAECRSIRFLIVNVDGTALPSLGPYVETVNHIGPDADGNVDTSGGAAAVVSVFGRVGVIAAAGADYAAFYDAIGAATAAQSAAIAAAATDATTKANNAQSAAIATAATDATTKANAAAAASQPLDADLTAIAALSTTAYGRALLALADAAALRTAAALGTAATSNTTAFDPAGAATAAAAASQPLDADLTAIAALTTTAYGRSFLALVDAGDGRTLLGLGSLATQSGTFSGTSSGTNTGDQTITLTGDVTGSGVGSFPATMKNTGTAGTYGDATHTVTVTTDAQGRVTAVTTNLITGLSFIRQLKTANYTAALGDYVAADTTGGAFTVTLPAASGGRGEVVLKWVAGTLPPTVAVTGTDHFDTSTGPTGGAFTLLNQTATYDSDGTSIYSVRNSFALSTLDARYTLAGAGGVSGQWGDGSDGTVTISSNTTLARDMYYDNLTINGTITLFTNGWRVYVRSTCTNNGTIGAPGVQIGGGSNNFGNGTGGGARNALMNGSDGGNGGSPVGTAGVNAGSTLLAGNGGAGGAGSGGAGGNGGVGAAVASTYIMPKSPLSAFTLVMYNATGSAFPSGGAGGGGGGGDGTNPGAGGGGGGGVVLLNARVLVNNGSINANGEAGRTPTTGNVGGGGGGAGGVVFVNTTSLSGAGTVTATGGIGGTKVGTGVNGSAGASGVAQTIVWTV